MPWKIASAARQLDAFFLNAAFQCGDFFGDDDYGDCPEDYMDADEFYGKAPRKQKEEFDEFGDL